MATNPQPHASLDPKSKQLLAIVREMGSASKHELGRRCGWTSSSLARTLEDLLSAGLLVEAGFGSSSGGRPPVLYGINPNCAYVLGLEISRTHYRLMLFDYALNQLELKFREMDASSPAWRVIDDVVGQVRAWQADYADRPILGLGIGAVGPLDKERGEILNPAYFPSEGWQQLKLGPMLEERLGLAVLLENGANTALLSEYQAIQDEEIRHVLYLHAGMGLRSAMIASGQLVTGAMDMESAVGQMIIQTDGRRLPNHVGNYGALESYATIAALEEQVRAWLKLGRTSPNLRGGSIEGVSFAQLLYALRQSDPLVEEAFVQTALYLGIGLANLINILHPEAIILGGPLITSNPIIFEQAVQTAQGKIYHSPLYAPRFFKSRLGETAGAAGAALHYLLHLYTS